jgi:hypothetical protein
MRLIAVETLLATVLAVSSCTAPTESASVTTTSEGQQSAAPAGTTAAEANTALVRFVNANPAAKGLNVLAGDTPAFENVEYKSVSAYMQMPRGYTQFVLRSPGNSTDLAATRRELFPGRHYTVVALPNRKGTDTLLSLSDNLGSLEPGEARVRLINATSNLDDIDLFKEGTDMRLAHGIDPGAATSFSDIAPGAVEVHRAGETIPMKLTMLPVEADRLYTIIVVGASNALDAVQIVDRIEN